MSQRSLNEIVQLLRAPHGAGKPAQVDAAEMLEAYHRDLENLQVDYAELLGRNTALELKVCDLEVVIAEMLTKAVEASWALEEKEDDGRQIVVDALANLLVKTAHKERNKALDQVQRLKESLEAIRDMKLGRRVDFRSRSDNQPSCYDLCKHKVMMKDTCEECIMEFAGDAIEGIE